MLNAVGFLLEFKNKASAGIEKITKDVLHLDKTWKAGAKSFDKLTKSMGLAWDNLGARLIDYAQTTETKLTTTETLLGKIGDVLGERVADIAGKLLSVEGVMVGLGALAFKAGSDYDQALKQMERATGATEEQIAGLGDSLRRVVEDTGASIDRTGKIMFALEDRFEMSREAAEQMTRTVVHAANVTGDSDNEIAAGLMMLRAQYGYTADELDALARGSVAMAQKTRTSLAEVFRAMGTYGAMLGNLSEDVQKIVLPQLMEISGVLSQTFADGPEVIGKLLQGMQDVSSKSFGELSFIFGQGGAEAMDAFRNGIKKGDIKSAFIELIKSVQKMRATGQLDVYKRLATGMHEALGFDMKTLDKLSKIDLSKVKDLDAYIASAATNANFMVEADKENRSVSEQLAALWKRFLADLIPIGNILVGAFESVMWVLDKVLIALHWVMNVPILGDILAWAAALGVIAVVVSGILAVFSLFGGAIMLAVVAAGLLLPILASIATFIGGIIVAIGGIALALAPVIALFVWWDEILSAIKATINWIVQAWSDAKWIFEMLGSFGMAGERPIAGDVFASAQPQQIQQVQQVQQANTATQAVADYQADLPGMLKDAAGSDNVVEAVWGAAQLIVKSLHRGSDLGAERLSRPAPAFAGAPPGMNSSSTYDG